MFRQEEPLSNIQLAVRMLIRGGIIFLILALDLFGVNTATDNASRQAFQKMVAPFHDTSGRQDIVVITISDTDLPNLTSNKENIWPMPYNAQADFLEALIAVSPKAIFWDIYTPYVNEKAPGFCRLFYLLSQNAFVPDAGGGQKPFMFVADALLSASPNKADLLKEDADLPEECVEANSSSTTPQTPYHSTIAPELVATGITPLPTFSYGEQHLYPLYINTQTNEPVSQTDTAISQASPAVALFQLMEPTAPQLQGPPLSLIWGNNSAPTYQLDASDAAKCKTADTDLSAMISFSLNAFKGPKSQNDSWLRPNPCMFHNQLSATRFMNLYNQSGDLPSGIFGDCTDIFCAFEGKIILVGADLAGINDIYLSPVQGYVPGVYVHATALDNLLTYGENYKKEMPILFSGITFIHLIEIAFALLALYYGEHVPSTKLYRQAPFLARVVFRLALFAVYLFLLWVLIIPTFWVFDYIPVNWVVLISIAVVASLPSSTDLADLFSARLFHYRS